MRFVETVDPQHRAGRRGCSACRHQADELGADDLCAARCCLLLDPRHDLVQSRRLPVLDVHRDLNHTRARKVEAERTHAGEAAARLAHQRGDLHRCLELAAQVDVERDQRPAGADDHATRALVQLPGAEVGLELAGVEPPLQLCRAAAPEERRSAAGRELAVEKDREAELDADPARQLARRLLGVIQVAGPDRDDRDHVRRADPRMRAVVAPQVDPLARARNPRQERLDEHIRLPDEREDGAVVVGVDVHVEQPRRCRERVAQSIDDLLIAPLGEVRHGFEHDSYSRKVKAYYEARAPEYDDWWLGTGRFAERERPGWEEEREKLIASIAALRPARTLDVACGTGFLTRHLPGEITGLDQSESMLELASERMPNAGFVQSDALRLPFQDDTFDRVFASHFYGHLEDPERGRFLAEARRVAPELVIVDSALRDDVEPAEQQERILNDGSSWQVFKRFFEPAELASELGGGETLFAGRWFVAVRSAP